MTTVDPVDHGTVRSALELAGRAPSVHNSQPWRWVLGATSVHLYADLSRWLPATDSEGRDLVVSCGAALHHLRVALTAAGLAPTVRRMPNPGEADHLAALELHPRPPSDADLAIASAVVRRRTDRRRFTDWAVPRGFVDELAASAGDQGALLREVTDDSARTALVEAIRNAAWTQGTSAEYETETALWSGRHAAADGVPAANLLRDPAGSGAGTARAYSAGLIEQFDTGEADGAQLFVLGTASDDPLSQLRAGEALSAVMLHATELGLATCPLSQPVEVGTSRRTVRDQVLGTTACPQSVLRVGWAPAGSPPLPMTPRRPVNQTFTRLPD